MKFGLKKTARTADSFAAEAEVIEEGSVPLILITNKAALKAFIVMNSIFKNTVIFKITVFLKV